MPNILVKGHLVQVFVCTNRHTHTHNTRATALPAPLKQSVMIRHTHQTAVHKCYKETGTQLTTSGT